MCIIIRCGVLSRNTDPFFFDQVREPLENLDGLIRLLHRQLFSLSPAHDLLPLHLVCERLQLHKL
jgi:hypothetical protein